MRKLLIWVCAYMTACAVEHGVSDQLATDTEEVSCSQTFCHPEACAAMPGGGVDCQHDGGADLQCQFTNCDGSIFPSCPDLSTADFNDCHSHCLTVCRITDFGCIDSCTADCLNSRTRHCLADDF